MLCHTGQQSHSTPKIQGCWKCPDRGAGPGLPFGAGISRPHGDIRAGRSWSRWTWAWVSLLWVHADCPPHAAAVTGPGRKRETFGFRNSCTTATRSSREISSVLRKATQRLPGLASVWFADGAACGCDPQCHRAFATSRRFVLWCHGALPEPGRASYAFTRGLPEWPPAPPVSSLPRVRTH